MRAMSREAREQIQQGFASFVGVCFALVLVQLIVGMDWVGFAAVSIGVVSGLLVAEYRGYLRKRSRRFGAFG